MDPRRAAWRVLSQVEASPRRLETLLDQELSRHPQADPRDKALASHLVYTVLRQRSFLDHLLAAFVRRPLAKLDPRLLWVLRLGAAELVCLRTPDHAAVHAAVGLAKALGLGPASGLANASLRALARDWPQVPPPAGPAAQRLAVRHSCPVWLVEELLAQAPEPEVQAWLAAQDQPRPPALRANTLRLERAGLRALLQDQAQGLEDHPLAPESLLLAGPHPPTPSLPGFAEGLWQMQDPGATALGHLLGVEPGQRVLDLCAGVGGKTGHLAALMANQGELVAVEPSPGRFKALGPNLARLGVQNARPLLADGLALPGSLGSFDRVLVDAPCSGLGVLGRRPDLRWRRQASDPARLARLQLDLALAAAQRLAPGGVLLYATCTVTRAENQEVVAELLARRPDLSPQWPADLAPELAACLGLDGFFRTQPQDQHCDAFFAARLARP